MSMTRDHAPVAGDAPDRVKVGVAEFAIASGDTLLTTSGLGSCVGVAVGDPDAGVAGLAHVMLPGANGDARFERTDDDTGKTGGPGKASPGDEVKPAKYVDRGVERLLAGVEAAGGDPDGVEAKLAGGSRMFDFSGVGEGVGQRNVERAREALAERGVPVVAEDAGGGHGRSLELDPGTWTLTVTSSHEGVLEL